MSCNVTIFGSLGRDPAIREVGQSKVANFSVASSAYDGKTKERTTKWFNVEVWGRQVDYVAQYFKKGARVYVGGEYINSSYQNKSGETVEASYVKASILTLTEKRSDTQQQAAPVASVDDIPF